MIQIFHGIQEALGIISINLLTGAPLGPAGPCGPIGPGSPFGPISPLRPISPISPGWPCHENRFEHIHMN